MSHTKRALEVCGILCGYDDYVTADRILRSMHDFDPASRIDETGIKRALRTIVQSKPGTGYRLRPDACKDSTWILPLLIQYLAATQPEISLHPALEGLAHRHGARALHYLVLLNVARELSLPVTFLYANSGSTRPNKRRVQVISLLVRGSRVILAGHDLERKQLRQFLLTRVSGPIEILSQKLPGIQSRLKSLYSDSLIFFIGARARDVAIRFNPEMAADVKREFYHGSQSITENSEGVTLRMRVNNREEVFAMLGQYLGRVEILEPAEWRNEYARRLQEGLRKNSASYTK